MINAINLSFGQNSKNADSLLIVWKNTSLSDSIRLTALQDWSWQMIFKNPDSTIVFLEKGIKLSKNKEPYTSDLTKNKGLYFHLKANKDSSRFYFRKSLDGFKKINNNKGIASSNNLLGISHYQLGEYSKALDYYLVALQYFEKTKDLHGLAISNNNIGLIYKEQGAIIPALDYLYKGLEYREQINDEKGIASSYNNIANVYKDQQEYDKALSFYNKTLTVFKKFNYKEGIAGVYLNIGLVYEYLKDYNNALLYNQNSLLISKEQGDSLGVASVFLNQGNIYGLMNEYDKALSLIKKAINIQENSSDYKGISRSYITISQLYYDLENFKLSEKYALKGLDVSLEISSLSKQNDAYNILYKIYEKTDKSEKSYKFFKLYINIKDSLTSEKNVKAFAKKEYEYKYDKLHLKDSIEYSQAKKLTDLKINNQKLEIKNQKSQKIALVVILILSVIVLIVAFYSIKKIRFQKIEIEKTNEELNQTNEEIAAQRDEIEQQKYQVEEAHQEIKDSIIYAKRIQNAILPTQELISELLPNSFVLYRPKDVVAGDFYWLEQIASAGNNSLDTVLFAAADCTGHGVPGAMVSVVCHNAMNRTVREFKLTEPGKILDKTREIVLEELSKSNEDVKDGMDIALCLLETKKLGNQITYQLSYAGAHNPLWIVRNNEILETKADKQPIGKFDNPTPFITHEIKLQKGDSIYIFSDGYIDQFGGEKDKKFGSRKLKELLVSIQDKSMVEQKEILETTLQNWMKEGNSEQLDDVCLIGLQV